MENCSPSPIYRRAPQTAVLSLCLSLSREFQILDCSRDRSDFSRDEFLPDVLAKSRGRSQFSENTLANETLHTLLVRRSLLIFFL